MNGKALLGGLHLKTLDMPDFIDVLAELHVQDSLHEEEVGKQMRKVRGDIMVRFAGGTPKEYGYDYPEEEYGMSNDNTGAYSSEPLPYIQPLEPTEDGYPGLDPPMG